MTRRPASSGFTIYEAMMVLLVVGVIVGALTPSVRRQLTRARINRAANVVAADLFLAQSVSGRQRVPVRVNYDGTTMIATITDSRPAATVYLTRRFDTTSEFKLTSLSASPTSILVLPNGMASASITITLSDGTGYQRQIRMTRAGLIRVT